MSSFSDHLGYSSFFRNMFLETIFQFYSKKAKCSPINNQRAVAMQKTRKLFIDSRKTTIKLKCTMVSQFWGQEVNQNLTTRFSLRDFANMFWDISMKKLTETERCLKQPLWSVILFPEVLGLYGNVFYVPSRSGKSYKPVYSHIFEYFLPARI